MYRSPSQRLRDDRGFTLIEVMVALGLFMIVTAAVLPQVIAGLRAAGTARDVTQAKGVAQAQIERMRNLPFYVGFSAGEGYLDVLDTYYTNTTSGSNPVCGSGSSAFPKTSWTGYVSETSTARCPYEPSGAFYRKVVNPVQAPGLGVFSMVIDTQFMTSGTTPTAVSPTGTYNARATIVDVPPAMQLATTVTVFYDPRRGDRYTSVYSQIDRVSPASPLVVSEAEVTTVRISSATDPLTSLSMDVGVVNLSGELFAGSRVSAFANSGVAANSLGAQATAASSNAVAPPDASLGTTNGVPAKLDGSCDFACFGNSQTIGVSASATNGLPLAGSPTAPVQATLPQGSSLNGFSFSNTKSPETRLNLLSDKPMVSLDGSMSDKSRVQNCAFDASSDPAVLRGTAYLNTTKGTTSTVDACATAQSSTVRLFRTDFAPDGVVKIDLVKARARCTVSTTGVATTPTAVADYAVTVSYKTPGGYTTLPEINQNTPKTGGLASVALTTPVGGGMTLGDYIGSWRSLSASDVVKTASGKDAEAALQGVVSIDTVPTRGSDETSVISLQVGALSCKAGDYR